jgi:solute carrier family 25 (mitochondrial folate transporter), member 32
VRVRWGLTFSPSKHELIFVARAHENSTIYRNWNGFPVPGGCRAVYRDEGWRGLYRGTTLALVGVGNGALQFMAYEKMKNWAFERKRRRFAQLGRAWTMQDDKLVPLLFYLMTQDFPFAYF